MYKQSAARRFEQANSSAPTIEQTPQTHDQAIAMFTDENSAHPSSPHSPSETPPNELHAIGTASASYIAPPNQPRTEVQMELYFARKIRQLELNITQRSYINEDKESGILATLESESSSAFASGKGVHWVGLPEEVAELTVGTREALRRAVREGRRRVVYR
jgi:hypothetical protein